MPFGPVYKITNRNGSVKTFRNVTTVRGNAAGAVCTVCGHMEHKDGRAVAATSCNCCKNDHNQSGSNTGNAGGRA